MEETRTVELGVKQDGSAAHEYELVPQRHTRIERKLIGKEGIVSSLDELSDLGEGAQSLENLVTLLGDRVWDVLNVFIPDLMPRYEFAGYASQQAQDADEYNESLDTAPSVPQIVNALKVAIDVNGLKWVGKLKDFFDPQLVRAQLNATAARWATEQRRKMSDENGAGSSASLPVESGGSQPTSSSAPEPTPAPPTVEETPSA